MASSTGRARSTGIWPLQRAVPRPGAWPSAIAAWLEAERDQLPLWCPVMLGAGITGWFVLPDALTWAALMIAAIGAALSAVAIDPAGRGGRAVLIAGLAVAAGCGLIWWRAERVATHVLARPAMVDLRGQVLAVEPVPARGLTRLTVALATANLPPKVRINVDDGDLPTGLTSGSEVAMRARLMPPAPPAVPGAYDFARKAWFDGLGAIGKAIGPVRIASAGSAAIGLREQMSNHIRERVDGSAGGIAAALATGDRGGIAEADDEALRRSGLAHLLSVSGLHVTAVVGSVFMIVLRLLALSPWLALRWPLRLIAGGAAAAAAVGYTLLTGAEVPTIRSCVAACLVLLALAIGREAMTMRLVAAGASIVLLLWPESLAGPSFQLSFAAVAAIVALHESGWARRWLERREEGLMARLGRGLLALLLTGIVVEIALMPIALYHFHRAGIYGAAANIVAIPLTTFVIMPLEALALLLDLAGLGAPIWWLVEGALRLLLWIAHRVAEAPGAVTSVPWVPDGALALIVIGGLWIMLWRTRGRAAGVLPILLGAAWIVATPPPDLLITGDGRHAAIRTGSGLALLRDRAGDYVRDTLSETGGFDGEPPAMAAWRGARCSPDLCLAELVRGDRRWRILATRSAYFIALREMAPLCRAADIVISDRRLPQGCTPRWLKLDRAALQETGGMAITLDSGRIRTVRRAGAAHPWRDPATVQPAPKASGA